MMRSIIGWSLRFRFLVLVLAAAVMVYGITQIGNMPVDVLPEFSPPFVEIQTEALGLSAKEVEQMITVPMEQDLLAGVAWADVIRSESVPGLSSVVIFFEPGTDPAATAHLATDVVIAAIEAGAFDAAVRLVPLSDAPDLEKVARNLDQIHDLNATTLRALEHRLLDDAAFPEAGRLVRGEVVQRLGDLLDGQRGGIGGQDGARLELGLQGCE